MADQMKQVFYNYNGRFAPLPPVPSDEQVLGYLESDACPLNEVVVGEQNKGNMEIIKTKAFMALRHPNRSVRGLNFGLYSSTGQGKTFIVRQFAKTIGVPFVLIQATVVKTTYEIFEMICEAHKKHRFTGDPLCPFVLKFPPVVECPDEESFYTIPPCIVLFDEAHQLNKRLMKGGLLNAMERDDGMMAIKPPGSHSKHLVVDCREVCWTIATTEKGDLFDALVNRIGTHIDWWPAGPEEVAEIVYRKIQKYRQEDEMMQNLPEISLEMCRRIAKYCVVPREAIGLALQVMQRYVITRDWERACADVARQMGFVAGGITKKQLEILKILGQRPVAETRLASLLKIRVEQLRNYELPSLMQYNQGGPYVVALTGRGLCITEKGLELLESLGIGHRGKRVTAEYFESRR